MDHAFIHLNPVTLWTHLIISEFYDATFLIINVSTLIFILFFTSFLLVNKTVSPKM